jgi:hypothetical protein
MKTAVPLDGYLLFLVVPPSGTGGAGGANAMLKRLSSLERDYSGGRALLVPEATPAFWQRVQVGK